MNEFMDVYDENKSKTNKTIKRKDKDSLGDGEYTISVHCFIINSNKEILLTKRNLNKNRGGKWEETHGGLRAGESSLEGITRELNEEIGLRVEPSELTLYTTLHRNNVFRDIYVLYKDIPLDSLNFNDGEVIDCKFVSLSEFKKMIEDGECTFKDFKDTIFYNSDILNHNAKSINIIHDASKAKGLTVIIDVFRAFTVEPYIISNGAKELIAVGDKQIAYDLKTKNPEYILIGEREGIKLPGFDYGNSPSQIENVDFSGKTVVHTTSCGTQGIVNAINAEEIITGSLVNLKAIVNYIKKSNIKEISLVSLAREGEEPFPEDQLCAEYIKALLENDFNIDFEKKIENLKNLSGKKFFDITMQENFPEKDFYLCIELNKFDFVLKVEKDRNNTIHIKKN